MKFEVMQGSVTDVECDVLVINLFEGVKEPAGATGAVDSALNGAIKSLVERQRFEGKMGQTIDLTPCGAIKAGRVVIVGLGKPEELDADKLRKVGSTAARRARDFSAKTMATVLHGAGEGGIDPTAAARALAEGAMLGTYQFNKYKTDNNKPALPETVIVVESDASKVEAIQAGIDRGTAIADAVCFARDLVNEPANVVTPTRLAEMAGEIAEQKGLEFKAIGRDEMRQMGMNLLLAVAKGSPQEPKCIVLRYEKPGATKTVAIVGKGITFDSGGINLKPGNGLKNMKDDMAGSAVVLAAMRAIADLKPNVNVLGLMPATENMIGGNATKVGDILTALSGKTVEIDNTDAEGRLILADAVAYAEKEKVAEIVDVATLTGACVVALGRQMAGVLGTNQGLVDRLIAAGAEDGEKLWQLPLLPDYADGLKSDVADMKNSGGGEAGTITGAFFIKNHVVGDTPWAHIDIAGPTTMDGDHALGPKGATGFGAATLINYVLNQ